MVVLRSGAVRLDYLASNLDSTPDVYDFGQVDHLCSAPVSLSVKGK